MEYQITYDPKNFSCFADENELKIFLNYLMRTDITQKWTSPLTRGNLYFLRNKDGELEYFTNVAVIGQRMQLKQLVLDAIKDVPLKALRNDVVYITPNIEKGQTLEFFSDLTAETLPGLWKNDCPFPRKEGSYLDTTIAFVLHVDQSYDGDTLQYHVHRLYSLTDEE